MATTQFSRTGSGSTATIANASLIPQKWSKQDYKWLYEINPLIQYMGTSDNSVIQLDKNFLKAQGDRITFALRKLLTGNGQTDDGTYQNNEEAMNFFNLDVTLHEQGHSTGLSGNMTEQSAYAKLRPKGRAAIREWVANVQTRGIIDSLSGLALKALFTGPVLGTAATDAGGTQIDTVNQVALTKGATALRWWGGGQTTAGILTRVASDSVINSTSAHLFGTLVISDTKRLATRTVDTSGNPISPVRPIIVNGEPWYLMFITRLQLKSLRAETAWLQAQREANLRGLTNPIFSGAEGIWDGVIIKVTDTLHSRLGAGGQTVPEFFDLSSDAVSSGITVNRALFCGAQACALAWGKMPVWKEGFKDPPHNTKWVTHTDWIYGIKKSVFATGEGSANVEFGCIVVDTAVNV